MTTLATFDILLRGDTRQFEQSMQRATHLGDGFIKNMAGIATGFLVANVAMKGFNAGLGLIQDGLIGYNARMEQASIGFKTLLGSAEKADNFVRQLQQFANVTPFDFPGLQHASTTMMAMGFAAQEVIPTLTAVGDVVAAMGKAGGEASESINRIVYNIGQMKQYGKVTGRDIRDLTMLGVPVVKILAQGFKVSTVAMQQMIAKGTVPADKAIKILIDGIEKGNMGHMMEAQAKTFNGAMSTISDVMHQLVGNALKPAFEEISKVAYAFSQWIQTPAAQAFFDKLSTAVRAFVIVLERAAPAVMNFAKGVIDGAKTALTWVGSLLTGVRDRITGMTQALATGGWNAIVAYAQGMMAAARTYLATVIDYITSYVGAFLIGQSPPKKGALSKIDAGGKAVIDAWVEGAMRADLTPITNIPKKISGGLKAMEAAARYIQGHLSKLNGQLTLVDLNLAKLQHAADGLQKAYDKAIKPLQKQYDLIMATYTELDKRRDLELELKKNALQQQLNAAKGDWWLSEQIQKQIDVVDQQAEQNRLLEEQQNLQAQIAGIPLEDKIKSLTDQLNAALDPINAQLEIYQNQREELQYQLQVWNAIADQAQKTVDAMKSAAGATAAGVGKKGGIGKKVTPGGGIPKDIISKVPDVPGGPDKKKVEAAAQQMADAFISSFGKRLTDHWPSAVGAIIGGLLGLLSFTPFGVALGATIGGAIGTAFEGPIKEFTTNGIDNIAKLFAGAPAVLGQKFTADDLIKGVSNMFQKLFDWVLNDAVPQLADILAKFAEGAIPALASAIQEFLKILPKVIGGILKFIAHNTPILLAKLIIWAVDFAGWLITKGGPLILDAVGKILGALPGYIMDLGGAIIGAAIELVASFIDVFDMDKTVGDVWQGIQDIGKAIQDGIGSIINFLTGLPGQVAGIFVTMVGAIVQAVISLPGTLFQIFLNVVSGIITAMITLPILVGSILVGVITRIVTFAQEIPGKAAKIGSDFVNGVVNFIKELPGKFAGFISSTISNITNFGKDASTKAGTAGQNFLNGVMDWIKKLPGEIAKVFSDIGTWIVTNAPKVAAKFGNMAESMGKAFKDGILGFLRGAIRAIVNAINSIQIHFDGFSIDMGPLGKQKIAGFNWNGMNLAMPSFAKGAWNLPQNMFANLHQGEMVLPKAFAEKFRQMASGDSGGLRAVTVNGPLVNIENFSGSDEAVSDLMDKMSLALRLQAR